MNTPEQNLRNRIQADYRKIQVLINRKVRGDNSCSREITELDAAIEVKLAILRAARMESN